MLGADVKLPPALGVLQSRVLLFPLTEPTGIGIGVSLSPGSVSHWMLLLLPVEASDCFCPNHPFSALTRVLLQTDALRGMKTKW